MGSSTNTVKAPLSPAEQELVAINTQLAKQQLKNINQLAPFQKELLGLTMADLKRQGAESAAMDAAVTPEQRAAASKSEFERTQRLGPLQDQILEMQMANMRGELTPGQQAATDAQIKAAHGDIDIATEKGIGLISDELANSRGLRLTDSPIMREAGMLSEAALRQKGSASANIRASALTQMPGASSAIGTNQQSLMFASQQFQDQLRQQAFQNRQSMTGMTANTGIGLSGRGASFGPQSPGSSSSSSPGLIQTGMGIGALAAGVGALSPYFAAGSAAGASGAFAGAAASGALVAGSDRRLKNDYGVVGETRSGVPLHLFKYKGERDIDPLRLGVMAQEVAKVRPEAVKRHSSGYLAVDYAGIGL